MKAVLRDHMRVDEGHIERVVFPASVEAAPVEGLFRDA
jgi:hypothetical protein